MFALDELTANGGEFGWICGALRERLEMAVARFGTGKGPPARRKFRSPKSACGENGRAFR
jgi:hypothetical protein